MRVFFSLTALLGLALLVALATGGVLFAQTSANQPGDPLAGSEWRPVEIAGKPVDANGMAFVRFAADGKVTGSSGCNRFFGDHKIEGSRLTLSPLGSTRKACPEPLMGLENRFLGTLRETAGFERRGAKLELRDDKGRTIMRLDQIDWD